MPKGKSYRYTGVLAIAPKPPRLRPGLINRGVKDPRQLLEEAFAERWMALHKDCGVSPDAPDAMSIIALTLAFRHVDGFKKMLVTRSRGAPKMSWKKVLKDYVIFMGMTERMGVGQSQRQAATYVAKKYPKLRLKADRAATAVDRRFRRIKDQLADGPELKGRFGAIAKRFWEKEAEARIKDNTLSPEQKSEYATALQVFQKTEGLDALAALFELGFDDRLRAALKWR